MIEFVEERIAGQYIGPSGQVEDYSALRRIDPVTGQSVRITGPRPTDSAGGPRGLPDISPEVERTRNCAFCAANVEVKTPRFLPAICPEGRFHRGDAVLFPNLMPYGKYSSVCIFSTEHHVALGDFTHGQYMDALHACLDYVTAVRRIDPAETRYEVISQNILPSSGGALLHPHLQVNLDREPMNYHRALVDRAGSAACRARLLELAEEEVRREVRLVARHGAWVFFTSFAPLAAWEVHAVCTEATRLDELGETGLAAFVDGVLETHAYWKSTGKNAANMSLFATADGCHPLFARLMVRSPYRAWYRSDRSCYEVGMLENATDMNPEVLAERMRQGRRGGKAA